ncbi:MULTISPECIES: hypothetical protein [unclassified Sphingobacterium]|uniref:hypothetical protein n=1 Tax=unclassified Sphingobacterium TaxID=2609468 RepID=UPI0025EB2FCB|nr:MULTISPECIES: hypothetical protein [unclassified Sphingobacterium]
MAIQKINSSDKLQTGFRSKYNATVDELWVSAVDLGNGLIEITRFNNTKFQFQLTTSFYTKQELQSIVSGVSPSTEQTAGIIRIATEDEAAKGTNSSTAITPYTLALILASSTVKKNRLDLEADITIDWQNDIYKDGNTYATIIGNDFSWTAFYYVNGVEADYRPSLMITRDDINITQVQIKDVSPGYIIFV